MVRALLGLCGLAAEEAVHDGRSALEGDCGSLSVPSDWSQSDMFLQTGRGADLAGLASEDAVLACGLMLQAEATAEAAKVCVGPSFCLMDLHKISGFNHWTWRIAHESQG